jgi:hypothetical protein
MVAGTLTASGNASAREGMSVGGDGGGKGDKECAKMGFTAVKLDKDDLAGSLEKEMKKIKTVADKHWPYDGGGKTDDEEKKKALDTFMKEFETEADNSGHLEDKAKMNMFITIATDAYEKRRMAELLAQVEKPEKLKGITTGGTLTLKILEKLSKSNKIDSSFMNTLKYLICLCKHWTSIYKAIQKANGVGKDGEEEEKPTKKKKETKKKKSKKDDNDDDDDE